MAKIKEMETGTRVTIKCFTKINPGKISIGRPIEGTPLKKKNI